MEKDGSDSDQAAVIRIRRFNVSNNSRLVRILTAVVVHNGGIGSSRGIVQQTILGLT